MTQSMVSLINLGKRWRVVGDYTYPLRNPATIKTGEKNPKAVLTDDIVNTIRSRYVSETGKQIYKDYEGVCSYTTFERALTGRTYSYLPIYRKKEKIWLE